MLTFFQCILSDVHYTAATRDSLTALRRLSSPVSYMRVRRTLCGMGTPLHQRGPAVRLDRPVRCGGRSTPCAGRATISVHSHTGRATCKVPHGRWLRRERRESKGPKGVATHGGVKWRHQTLDGSVRGSEASTDTVKHGICVYFKKYR